MSQENVEIVRRAYERFASTGEPGAGGFHADFVWDMSTYQGWPEQPTYHGVEGMRQFLADWAESWDDWRLELEELHDAGPDKVVAIMRQRGRSKTTDLTAEMHFAQVWTLRDGELIRTEVYATPQEGLEAVGL